MYIYAQNTLSFFPVLFPFFQCASFVMNHSFHFYQICRKDISESMQGLATAHSSLSTGRRHNGFHNDFSFYQSVDQTFDVVCRSSDSPQDFAFTGRSASLRIVFGFRITQTGSFFILPLLPPLITTILANSILTGECDNSGRTTSLCARGIFIFHFSLYAHP